ncbi:hypothetical protein DFJ74DRAFT_693013 [Hyaloraphidium curvatum]|nr:hypothetical protein DFJ74DRAFT_693013 [Hyaloraphidium curvatum]
MLRAGLFGFSHLLMLLPLWIFNESYRMFGARQLIASTLAFITVAVCDSIMVMVVPQIKASYSASYLREGPTIDSHEFAGVARWNQLASEIRAGADPGILLAHDPCDRLCPCPAKTCAGGLPEVAGRRHFAQFCVGGLYGFLTTTIFSSWTVYLTFGPTTWGTWWSCIIGIFNIFAQAFFIIINGLVLITPNYGALRLNRRIHHRAMMLVAQELLDHYHSAIFDPACDQVAGLRSRAELLERLARLHGNLVRIWRSGLPRLYAGSGLAVFSGFSLLAAAVIDVVGGHCLPANIFFVASYIHIGLFGMDLFNMSTANSQISDVSGIHARAGARVRMLLARCDVSAHHLQPAERAALTSELEHARGVLELFARADQHRSTLFGFPVDFAVARSYLSTVLVLGVGFASVLKGFGVTVTIQTSCPKGLLE